MWRSSRAVPRAAPAGAPEMSQGVLKGPSPQCHSSPHTAVSVRPRRSRFYPFSDQATSRIFNTSNDRASARRWRQGFQHVRDREPNPEFRRPIPHSPDVRLRVTGARACRVQTALA